MIQFTKAEEYSLIKTHTIFVGLRSSIIKEHLIPNHCFTRDWGKRAKKEMESAKEVLLAQARRYLERGRKVCTD